MVINLGVAPSVSFQPVDQVLSNTFSVATDLNTDGCTNSSGTSNSTNRSRAVFSYIQGKRQRLMTASTSNASSQGSFCTLSSSNATSNTFDFYRDSPSGESQSGGSLSTAR